MEVAVVKLVKMWFCHQPNGMVDWWLVALFVFAAATGGGMVYLRLTNQL
jgi:hypothetical protein